MSLPQWEVLVSLGRTPMKGLLGLLLVQDLFQGYEFLYTGYKHNIKTLRRPNLRLQYILKYQPSILEPSQALV